MAGSGLQPLNLVLAILPSIVCVIIVSFRVWIRLRSKRYAIEDSLLVTATILNLVLSFTTCGYILASYRGYHMYDVPAEAIDSVSAMKWNYANSVIYNPILALVKASFLLTLIKLRSQNTWVNHCLWTTFFLNIGFAIGAPLACILQCNPIAKYWDPSIPGQCVNPGAYIVSTSSIVLATDVLVLIMPSWILYDLKMSLGRKIMVVAFLSFGVGLTIVGAVRTSVLVKVFVVKEEEVDPAYNISYVLSNIESALAILGTCGPTIKQLLSACVPALKCEDERNYVSRSASMLRRERRRGNYDARLTDQCDVEHPWYRVGSARDDIEPVSRIIKTVEWHVDDVQSDMDIAVELR